MNRDIVSCSGCDAELPWQRFNTGSPAPCPTCQNPVLVHVFPALFEGLETGRAGTDVLVADEASCFFHPTKAATLACDGCGRFLCSLCDLELGHRHLCPNCLETNQQKGRIAKLAKRRVMYDSIALWLALLPILMIWPTIITAPAALFLAIRHRNGNVDHPLGRNRVRVWVAGSVSVLLIGAWAVGLFQVFS